MKDNHIAIIESNAWLKIIHLTFAGGTYCIDLEEGEVLKKDKKGDYKIVEQTD